MLEMRTSERKSLKTCAQQWWWENVDGYRPNVEKTPFWFGTAVHAALATYYPVGTKRGPHPAETFDALIESDRDVRIVDEESEAEYVDGRELGIDMLTRYVEHWGPEENIEYIAAEWQGNAILPRPAMTIMGQKVPKLERWLKYNFTWDGVLRDLSTDEVWLDEHKTAASIWDDLLPLDDQAGSYWAMAGPMLRKRGVLGAKEDIAGIRYNFLRKAMGDTRPTIDVNGVPMRVNKPTSKQHYFDSIERAGYDVAASGITEKTTMAVLAEFCEDNGILAHGDVSAKQPGAYFERFPVYRSAGERATQIRRIQDEAVFKEAYINGGLPITKTPGMACRFCSLRRVCELDEQGDQLAVNDLLEFGFHKQDSGYEKNAEGVLA